MTPALDGSNYAINFFGTSQAVTLSTTNTNDLIVVDIVTTGGPVTSVTASGLTFSPHASAYNSASGVERWTAVASGTLSSETITVNTTSSGVLIVVVFGVSGANTSSPWQVSAVTGENASGGVDPLSISPTAAAFVVGLYQSTITNAPTAGSGFTAILDGSTSGAGICSEYEVVASSGAVSVTLNTGAGNATAGIVDAIAPAGGGASQTPYNPWPQMGPILAQHHKPFSGWTRRFERRHRPLRG